MITDREVVFERIKDSYGIPGIAGSELGGVDPLANQMISQFNNRTVRGRTPDQKVAMTDSGCTADSKLYWHRRDQVEGRGVQRS
jgi:hypothetical protein